MTSRAARKRDRDHTRAAWTPERRRNFAAGWQQSPRTKAWTPDEEAVARNLWEEGVHVDDIKDTVRQLYGKDRSINSVIGRMHKIGAQRGEPTQKRDTSEWSEEHLAILRAARARGEGPAAISKLIDRTAAAIASKIHRIAEREARERAVTEADVIAAHLAGTFAPYNPATDPKPEWLRRRITPAASC